MNREEILARSRAEQNDEGMRDAEEKGRRIGIRAFCLVEVIVLLFNFFTGQPNYVPMAMFWAFAAAEAYPKYRFTGKRSFLAVTIMGGVCSLLFLVCHILSVLLA